MESSGEILGGGLITILASTFLYMVKGFFRKSETDAKVAEKEAEAAAQPVNPELVALTKQALEMFGVVNQTSISTQTAMQEIAGAVRLLSATITDDSGERNKEHQGIVDALSQFNTDSKTQHDKQTEAIEAIEPALSTLTQQLIQTESRIDSTMEKQTVTNGEILAALLRIEKDLREMKDEFANRTEKLEADVAAVKADVIKNSAPTPAPDNQPVVMPKPPVVPPDTSTSSTQETIPESYTITNPKPKEDKEETK